MTWVMDFHTSRLRMKMSGQSTHVIEDAKRHQKKTGKGAEKFPIYVCPSCKRTRTKSNGFFFCRNSSCSKYEPATP